MIGGKRGMKKILVVDSEEKKEIFEKVATKGGQEIIVIDKRIVKK